MKNILTFLAASLIFIACGSSSVQSSSIDTSSSDKDTMQIVGIKCIAISLKVAKDSLVHIVNPKLNDVFIFDTKRNKLTRYINIKDAKNISDSIEFLGYQLTKHDIKKYLPEKILDFELKGTYKNANENEDDINIFSFYVNPKSKDIIEVDHEYFIGNISVMNVFTHDIHKDYFKDKPNLIKEILRYGTPVIDTDTVTLKVNPKMR